MLLSFGLCYIIFLSHITIILIIALANVSKDTSHGLTEMIDSFKYLEGAAGGFAFGTALAAKGQDAT